MPADSKNCAVLLLHYVETAFDVRLGCLSGTGPSGWRLSGTGPSGSRLSGTAPGSPIPGSPLPHLHRDSDHTWSPAHICTQDLRSMLGRITAPPTVSALQVDAYTEQEKALQVGT